MTLPSWVLSAASPRTRRGAPSATVQVARPRRQRCSPQRQAHREASPSTGLVFHHDRAVVALDEGARDRKAEAYPFPTLPATCACPSERLEDPLLVGHRNTGSVIGDRDPRERVPAPHLHGHS